MIRRHTLSRAAFLVCLLPLAVDAQATVGIGRLGWLAGCWEQRAGNRISQEQWMAPLGGLMLGMSRTVVGDVAREYEQLRIEVRDGVGTYVASPSGQTTTAFAATQVSDTLVVFENPQHDFPTKISYRKVGRDTLLARIEGPRGGQIRGIDFPMGRGRCP